MQLSAGVFLPFAVLLCMLAFYDKVYKAVQYLNSSK